MLEVGATKFEVVTDGLSPVYTSSKGLRKRSVDPSILYYLYQSEVSQQSFDIVENDDISGDGQCEIFCELYHYFFLLIVDITL